MMKYAHLIKKNKSSALSTVPFHEMESCIDRIVAENFPLHLAIHEVKNAKNEHRTYVTPHTHDVAEINLLIGKTGDLRYRIQLDEEVYEVESPASIWIPPRLQHSATVIQGSGYFVCLILTDTKSAFKTK